MIKINLKKILKIEPIHFLLGVSTSILIASFLAVQFLIPFSNFLKPNVTVAASVTWNGSGVDNNWSTGANWVGGVAPGAGDVAVFDGTSTKNATIDAGFAGSVSGISVNAGYTGVISQGRSVIVGASGYTQADGTFTGSADLIDLNGAFTMTGGVFTATSGTMTIAGDLSTVGGGTFNHNNGTVIYDELSLTHVWDIGPSNSFINFYNFTMNSGGGILVNTTSGISNLNILNDFNLISGDISQQAIGILYINVTRNMLVDASFSGTGAIVYFVGGGNSTFDLTGYPLSFPYGMRMNKTGGKVTMLSNLKAVNGLVLTGGGTWDLNGYDLNMEGGSPFSIQYGAKFLGRTGDIKANRNMIIGNNGVFTSTSGTLTVKPNLYFNSSSTFNHNNGTVVFDWGGSAYILGSFSSITFNNLTMNGYLMTFNNRIVNILGNLNLNGNVGSAILNMNGDVTIGNSFGSLSGVVATFVGNNTQNFDSQGAPNNWNEDVIINKTGGSVILATDLDLSTGKNVNITAGTLDTSINNYNISLDGNWINNGTFIPNNSTVEFVNSATTSTLFNDNDFYNLAINTPSKTLNFEAGSTQNINGTFSVAGTGGNDVILRSTVSGTEWLLNIIGGSNVDYVDVQDSNASSGLRISPVNWVDGGNNLNWGSVSNSSPDNVVPVTDFGIEINSSDVCTSNSTVTVRLTAKNAIEYLLDDSSTFINAEWKTFEPVTASDGSQYMDVTWDFSNDTFEEKVLYVHYQSSTWNRSNVINDTILYLAPEDCGDNSTTNDQPPADVVVPPPSSSTSTNNSVQQLPVGSAIEALDVITNTCTAGDQARFDQAIQVLRDFITSADDNVSPKVIQEVFDLNPGDYIQGESFDDIYYIDIDPEGELVRNPVLDLLSFFTYENTLQVVKKVTDTTLTLFNLGEVKVPRTGVVLIKFTSRPEIYAIAKNPKEPRKPYLIKIEDEIIPIVALGEDWRKYIVELDVAFYKRFVLDGSVTNVKEIKKSKMKTFGELKDIVTKVK